MIAGGLLGAAFALVAGGDGGDAPEWRPFPAFVWFVGEGPPHGEAAFRELAAHGLDGINLEASQAHGAAAQDAGLRVYVGHAAGKGDLHLRPQRFQEDLDRFFDQREGARPRRPSCLSDPALLDALRDRVRATVQRQAGVRPLGYSLDDEISTTSGVNPFDYCFEERCLVALREWLEQEHGSLEALNRSWGTDFPRWDEVVPATTDEIRRGLGARPLEQVHLGAWTDHRAFQDELLGRLVDALVEELTSLAPGVPAGFLGGQAPSAFGGFDWWRLTRRGSFFEAYDHGAAPRLVRDFAVPGARLVTTLFLDEGGRATESVTAALWRAVARGEDGVVVWASDRVFQGRQPALSEAGQALAGHLRRVREVRDQLGTRGRPPARVGVYVSMASVRAAWMLDSWVDGATWPRRFTSWEYDHGRSILTREAWATLLDKAGLPWRFVDSRQLLAGGGAVADLDALVLNEALALSDAELGCLRRFVEQGGTLVADAHVAWFDEHLRGRGPEAHAELLGLGRDASVPFDRAARRLAGSSGEGERPIYFGLRRGEPGLEPGPEAQAVPLGWTRPLGQGRTLLLDVDLTGVRAAHRERPGKFQDLRGRLWDLWREVGVTPPARVQPAEGAPAVRPVFFRGDGADPALLLVPVQDTWQRHAVEVEFPQPVRVRCPPDAPPSEPVRRLLLEVPARDLLLLTWGAAGP